MKQDNLPEDEVNRAMLGEYLRFWNTLAPTLTNEQDDVRIVAEIEKLRQEYAADKSEFRKMVGKIISDYPGTLNAHHRVRANRRTLDAYIACLAFRQEHKRWPKNLAEVGIIGDRDFDILANGPLHYKVTDDGIRVWNVGRNGVDDGGITRTEAVVAKRGADNSDNVYIYPWPKR